MSFKKDYKLLWEATKLDLNDQVAYSARLADEIKSLEDQLTNLRTSDTTNLRERIAVMVANQGGWVPSTASAIIDWITDQPYKHKEVALGYTVITPKIKGKRGPKKGIKRGPYKKTNGNSVGGKMRDAVKSKRKYTKKSKFWKKKK